MTQEEKQQDQYEAEYGRYEDEIQFIDLLRVIWKWKWIIAFGSLIFFAAAVVFSYHLPNVYRIDMILGPGILGINDRGMCTYLDTTENISQIINEQFYNKRILESLNIDPEEVQLVINAYKNTKSRAQIVRVSSEWEENRLDLGLAAMNSLIELISNDYKDIVQQVQLSYDSRIQINKNKINDIELQKKDLIEQIRIKEKEIVSNKKQIAVEQERYLYVKQQIEKLLADMENIKQNSEKFTLNRQSLINNRSDEKDDMLLMLYGTMLQQNIMYLNELNTQVFDLTNEKNKIESHLTELESDINKALGEIERLKLQKFEGVQIQIDDANAEIERLQSEKQIISNIKVIKPPEVSAAPIKPKKKQIAVLSGIGALFIFMFLAFFIEYVRKASKSYNSSKFKGES